MRPTPPFTLLTFLCGATERYFSIVGPKNAAIVLKSPKGVKELFWRFFMSDLRIKTIMVSMT